MVVIRQNVFFAGFGDFFVVEVADFYCLVKVSIGLGRKLGGYYINHLGSRSHTWLHTVWIKILASRDELFEFVCWTTSYRPFQI